MAQHCKVGVPVDAVERGSLLPGTWVFLYITHETSLPPDSILPEEDGHLSSQMRGWNLSPLCP